MLDIMHKVNRPASYQLNTGHTKLSGKEPKQWQTKNHIHL
jgi:hypothetical protein